MTTFHAFVAAMHEDGMITIFVTAATLIAVYVLFTVWQLLWYHLEPLVFVLVEAIGDRWSAYQERRKRAKAARARPRVVRWTGGSALNSMAQRTRQAQQSRGISRGAMAVAGQTQDADADRAQGVVGPEEAA